jgi:hypothetical protein
MGWAIYVLTDVWASIQQEGILDALGHFREESK